MSLNPALVALFNGYLASSNGLHMQRLYTFQLAGGGSIRLTDADFDILGNNLISPNAALVNGQLYSSGGVRVDQKQSKTQAHLKVGTDTDTWTVVFMPRPVDLVTGAAFPDTIGSVPFLEACQGGAFDAADLQVDEAYFSGVPTWPMPPGGLKPVGCKTIFAGEVAEIDNSSLFSVFTINDYRSLLTLQVPLQFYQGQCRFTLFDAGCQLPAASFAINGTVSAGSTQATIIANGLPKPQGSGTYQLGRMVFTSGLNAGFQRTIKSWDGSFTLGVLNPFSFDIAAGDTFTVYPGCNKLLTTCALFNNTINYGGQPFIPAPEIQGS